MLSEFILSHPHIKDNHSDVSLSLIKLFIDPFCKKQRYHHFNVDRFYINIKQKYPEYWMPLT